MPDLSPYEAGHQFGKYNLHLDSTTYKERASNEAERRYDRADNQHRFYSGAVELRKSIAIRKDSDTY